MTHSLPRRGIIRVTSSGALFSVYLLSLALLAYFSLPDGFTPGGGGWWVCVDYVGQGTLYGGQPYCAQGPVIYYVGYALNRVIGWIHQSLPLAAVSMLSQAAIFLILRRLLQAHGIYHPLLYPPLYILMVLRSMGEATSSLATALFLGGFYLLCRGRGFRSSAAAGLAFSLAFLTKYTVAVPTALAVVYVCFLKDAVRLQDGGRGRKILIKPDVEGFKRFLAIATIILASVALAKLEFPHIVEYTIAGHAGQMKGSLFDALFTLAQTRSLATVSAAAVLVILAACAAMGFFGRETIIYPAAQLMLVAYGIFFAQVPNVQDANIGTPYMLPAYPLLLAAFMAVRKRSQKAFCLLVLVAVVYPSMFGSPLSEATRAGFDAQADLAVKAVGYGMHFIPQQGGLVLTEGPVGTERTFRDYGAPIDPARVVVLNQDQRRQVSYTDATWAPQLAMELNITRKATGLSGNYSDEDKRLRDDILAGRYTLIVEGPPAWEILAENLNAVGSQVSRRYCEVFVPNFLYQLNGRSYTSLYFMDLRDCMAMRASLKKYYTDNFNEMCSLGSDVDSIVRRVALWDGYRIPYTCGNKIPFVYSREEKYKFRLWDPLAAAVLLVPTYLALSLLEGMSPPRWWRFRLVGGPKRKFLLMRTDD